MRDQSDKFLSAQEAADLLGMSKTHVIRKIKSGEIPAQKVGNSYVIRKDQLPGIFRTITPAEKKKIEAAVRKVIEEYGEVLQKLGKE